MRSLLILAAAGALVLTLGCAPREHLRKDWGRSVHARFAKQQVFLEPAEGMATGLDSEEAAMINASYRQSMAGGQAAAQPQQQVLILETSKQKKK